MLSAIVVTSLADNTAGGVTLNGLTLRNGRRLGGSNSSFSGGAVRSLSMGTLAIDHGNNVLAVDANGAPLTLDQRGISFPRIVNTTVDMGACEGTFLIVSTNVDESDGNFSIPPYDCATCSDRMSA